MASKINYVDIDLNKNQLLNAVVQNLPSAPLNPKEGQIYYNTSATDMGMYGFIGSRWVELSHLYNHPIQSALSPTLTGANVLATFETNLQGHVIEATTRLLTLEDLGYTGVLDANNYNHPTFTNNDLGNELDLKTIISDVDVNNEGHVTGFKTRELTPADIGAAVVNDSVTNGIDTWSSTKIQSEIDTINSTITGQLIYKGGYDATTNTPNLESGTNILQGYTYTVTVNGNFYTMEVQAGDMLIAETSDPQTVDDWTVVNKNIPDIVDATNQFKGIIRIATQGEVNAGTSTNTAVTPATLVNFVNAEFNGHAYATNIGNGTDTSFDLSHGLNSKDVIVSAFYDTTGDEVGVTVRRTTTSNVRILVNEALTNNELRVVIIKR